MKVVINKCFGGYSISPEAALWLLERGFNEPGFKTPVGEYWRDDTRGEDDILGHKSSLKKWREFLANKPERRSLFLTVFSPDEQFVLDVRPEPRSHPLLVECVETLKEAADGSCARLRVVEIPDDIEWSISEYDGQESIHETHESWG